MRLITVTAPFLGASCHLVVVGSEVVVVDAGGGAAPLVDTVVAREGLTVVGLLATHGHVDHLMDAGRVAAGYGVPLTIHAHDAHRVGDPWRTLGFGDPTVPGQLASMLAAAGCDAAAYQPAPVSTFGSAPVLDPDGWPQHHRDQQTALTFGAITVTAIHAPGHTAGSTLYRFDAADAGEAEAPTILTGDVLFAGSIGRTDLPGGDGATMARTLAEVIRTLPREATVLPGHGPATTVAIELQRNPYLRDSSLS